MPAVAITDHGNLFGAIEFYQEAQRAGVKPIIGCEAYVAPGSHKDRPPSRRESAYHFTLLAENETGYRNLVKLVSAGASGWISLRAANRQGNARGALGGFDRIERLPRRRNQQRDSGKQHRRKQNRAPPNIAIFSARKISSSNCTITGWRSKKNATRAAADGAANSGVGLVAANDVHFLAPERSRSARRHALHRHRQNGAGRKPDALSAGTCISNRRTRCGELFRDFPEAIANTLQIAERCNLDLEFGEIEISGVSGAGGQNARRIFARALLPGFARALRRTGDGRFGTDPAARLRTRCSGENRVRQLSPHRLGFHSFREGARDSGRSGARLGRGLDRRLCPRDHGHRSAAVSA